MVRQERAARRWGVEPEAASCVSGKGILCARDCTISLCRPPGVPAPPASVSHHRADRPGALVPARVGLFAPQELDARLDASDALQRHLRNLAIEADQVGNHSDHEREPTDRYEYGTDDQG